MLIGIDVADPLRGLRVECETQSGWMTCTKSKIEFREEKV